MFKAKLVEDSRYYGIKNRLLIISMVIAIPISLLSIIGQTSLWINILGAVLYIATLIYVSKNHKLMERFMGNRTIIMDQSKISIRTNNGQEELSLDIDSAQKLIINKSTILNHESIADLKNQIKGKPNKNFIIINSQDQERHFDFEVESHYMMVQLDKLIKSWISKGYNVELA